MRDMSVPQTKRYPRPEDDHLESGSSGQAIEIQTRIACRGRSAQEVLEELRQALTEAETCNANPLIVLEDLGHLQDSVATLIKAISRLLVGYRRTVTFWKSSGYTEAFLSVMEAP